MVQRFTVTKIQKVLVDLEESAGQGGSRVTLRGCGGLEGVLKYRGQIDFGDLTEGLRRV